jgi:hypothetical protein
MQPVSERSGFHTAGTFAQLPIAQIAALVFLLALGCQSKESGGSTTIASKESAMASNGAAIKASPTERPIAPEKNPPGAIPKNQQFVSFKSTSGGYQLDVPKGWASTETGPNVTFLNDYDGLNVAISSSNGAPTPGSVRENEARLIQAQGRAVKMGTIKAVKLPGGNAVQISYTSNSEPEASKTPVRLQNTAYLFFNSGTVGWLTWWAPQGADVSALSRAAKTFKWQ